MIDFDYDDVDAALADSVLGLGVDRVPKLFADGVVAHDADWWREVAALGVLGLATDPGGGAVTTIAAAMEALGRCDAPGPFVETFVAMQLLPDDDVADGVATGELLVTIATSQPVPWLPIADVVVAITDGRATRATVSGVVETLDSLAGEPWGRATLAPGADLGDAHRALAIGDVAASAYLVGEAEHLLSEAAQYASDRIQFGVPIASFQSVSHPLADCHLRLSAARALTRRAAHAIDHDTPDASTAAATARRSATRAALDSAFRAHQTHGAMGFTVEGPIGNRSAKIRQVSLAASTGDTSDRVLAGWGL